MSGGWGGRPSSAHRCCHDGLSAQAASTQPGKGRPRRLTCSTSWFCWLSASVPPAPVVPAELSRPPPEREELLDRPPMPARARTGNLARRFDRQPLASRHGAKQVGPGPLCSLPLASHSCSTSRHCTQPQLDIAHSPKDSSMRYTSKGMRSCVSHHPPLECS